MEGGSNEMSSAFIIMEPKGSEGDNSVLLMKDMMLDEQEQQCILEVYSEAPNDEFVLPDNFPDEIHIDINLDSEEIPYLEEVAVMPKRVTAANQVLPLLTSVYEDRNLEEEAGLASDWRDVLQAFSARLHRDNCACSLCGCIFVSPTKLLSHAIEVHGELDLKGLQECFVCRKSYVFPSSLNFHLEHHHGLPVPHMTCSVCCTQLNSRSELKAHERKHDLSESCKMCFERFPSRHQLSQHVQSVHSRSFPCPHCRGAFNHQITYRKHLQRHKSFYMSSCAKCNWRPEQAVDPELSLLEHLHSCQSPDQLQTFLAGVMEEDRLEEELDSQLSSYFDTSRKCDKRQNKSEEELCLGDILSVIEGSVGMCSSQSEVQAEVQSFCKLCTRVVSELDQIPAHVQDCHPKSKQCPICKKRFPSVKRAQTHTQLHFKVQPTAPKEYKCQYCEKRFKESGKLNRHIETIHLVNIVERPFQCHLCGKPFQSIVIRDRHLITHNVKGNANLDDSAPAPLKCSYCTLTFIKTSFLSKHTEKYHSKQITPLLDGAESTEDPLFAFHCKICGEGMETLNKLKSHVIYKHGASSAKDRFKCSLCEIGCRTAVGLRVHMRTHTNERPYICTVCQSTFKRKQALTEHYKRMHYENKKSESLQKLFSCPEGGCCMKQVKKNSILKHFLRVHRNLKRYICGLCGECYCQNQELKQHMNAKHNVEAPSVVVRDTNKLTDIYVFPSIDKLPPSHPHSMLISQIIDDQRKKTENIPEFPVVFDKNPIKKSKFVKSVDEMKAKEKEFAERLASLLQKHSDPKVPTTTTTSTSEVQGSETIIYDNSGIFHPVVPDLESIAAPNTEASINLAAINNDTYLNIINKAYEKIKPQFPEMVAVVNIPPKSPNEPNAVLSEPNPEEEIDQPTLSISIKTGESKETDARRPGKLKFAAPRAYPFRCDAPDCDKTFGDGAKLLRHKKSHSDARPFECATCLKRFREKGNLVVHMRSHTKVKPYSCDMCSKSYRYLQEFKKHKLEHTGEIVSYPCPHCPDRSFKRTKDLNRHLRIHQVDAPSFQCKICGTVLARKDTLLLHLARKHSGDQFKCGICKKSFALEQQLKQHKNIHTGVKEHKCDVCGRTFALRSYLVSHLKRHEQRKQYLQCTLCPRKFISQKTMEVHQASFHAKGVMLQRRQQKQEALQKQEDARRAALAASALDEDMLHVDFELDDDPNSQVVYLQVLSDADLALLPP